MGNLKFEELETVDNIKDVVKNLFDVELNISGGWGYNEHSALIVHDLSMPIEQFMNLFATLRANIEMNLTLDSDKRYGGITVQFEREENHSIENKKLIVATFKISAMRETDYAQFIKEYKENYGKKEFDLADHFKRRKEQTLTRLMDYWFIKDA